MHLDNRKGCGSIYIVLLCQASITGTQQEKRHDQAGNQAVLQKEIYFFILFTLLPIQFTLINSNSIKPGLHF